MKKIAILAAVSGLLFFTGCTHKSTAAHMSYPIQEADFTQDKKSGEACAYAFLSIFGSDVSVRKAAENGKVNQVKYVEIKDTLFKHCVKVYGN